MDMFSYLLGKKASGGGGGGGLDWSAIGYSQEPQSIIDDYNYSKDIYDNWDNTQTDLTSKFANNGDLVYMPLVDTSNATNMYQMFYQCQQLTAMPLLNTENATNMMDMFYGCIKLKEIPQMDISNATNITGMFSSCRALKNVPVLNGSSLKLSTSMQNVFSYCISLTDTSLDNILQLCISATIYSGTKTLYRLGIQNSTVYPASRIQALPHYQDFIDAGWTIGY